MAGSTPAEAVQNYLDPIRRALSCVTQEVVQVGRGYFPSPEPHILALARNNPVRLKGDARIALLVSQQYLLVKDEVGAAWKVSTASYAYALEDKNGREIVAYHWHPFAGVPSPHLHVRAAADLGRSELTKAHLPTGRIAVEQVIRLAITELGAVPLRDDWEQVLEETQARFEASRTWS